MKTGRLVSMSNACLAVLASICCLSPLRASPAELTNASPPALLIIYNRPIITLRANAFDASPAERVQAIQERADRLMDTGRTRPITTRESPEGTIIEGNGHVLMVVSPNDLDPMSDDTLPVVVDRTVKAFDEVFTLHERQHSLRYLVRACVLTSIATLVYGALLWVGFRTKRWLGVRSERWRDLASKSFGDSGKTFMPQLVLFYQWAARGIFWILLLGLTDAWITFCLHQFPYTAPWGEALLRHVWLILRGLGIHLFEALPNVLVVAVILIVTRSLTRVLRTFFTSVRARRLRVAWLDPDAARPTGRIAVLILWAFALVMIYPYLPGSDSEAFKGVSVFVGLLISLGGAGVVGQVMGGFVLMYTRALRVGQYVRIGEHEGTVESIGYMSTRIRTIKNEEVNIPNTLLMSQTMINFSQLAEDEGVMVYTSVTIGYDAPWRQVHALLLRAAEKTPGLRATPSPYVLQRALSDFYAEYEINAYIEVPNDRIAVLSNLAANIQDEFNEHGVQILSPHFMMNPPQPAIVPRARWHTPPVPSPSAAPPSQAPRTKPDAAQADGVKPASGNPVAK